MADHEKMYGLNDLRDELAEKHGGAMAAYEVIKQALADNSVEISEITIRKWFMDNKHKKLPAPSRPLWDVLEKLSGKRLKRWDYHPLPEFWRDAHTEQDQ